MDTIAASVLEGLTSLALEEFKLLRNATHDIEIIKNTVHAIRSTLLDAEEKANNNHQVSLWLARLKDVLYDADDLLDELSTEALRRGTMTQNKVAKKPLPVLEDRRQTYSFVQGDEIVGREVEKDFILRYLFDSNVKFSVSTIPIVGFGGLGKTVLAQLVYNHEGVQDYFKLTKWVCVSDEFVVKQIAQKILGQGGPEEMEKMQQDFRKLIKGKKFFFVFDDVWNEDVELWHKLKNLLNQGAEGSMIIVTTRSDKVGQMMGTHAAIVLKGLDGERSWELFCRMAFVEGREPNDKELLAVGREIVNKCGGVPLAIRAVGSLVYEKTSEGITDLSCLKNCELWNVDKSLDERVFAVLKLSYDHLPPPMKNCVAFCSLFSKDFSFKKQMLIQMWMAEGFTFTQSVNQMRSEEDVGNEYFMNLLSRSFFQDAERDVYDSIVACKMHDLIHDLALLVATKTEYVSLAFLIKYDKQ